MEKYSVKDLVNNYTSESSMEDMMHICKRYNNAKRDYLFVNKYQGKHIPVSPNKVYDVVSELYDKVYEEVKSKKKILFIGFAETATAIGELIFYFATHSDKKLDAVTYVHTTREEMGLDELIEFSEEHSHATEQRLFIKNKELDFDTVVFVEDEISTGNTILNAIKKFEQKKHISNYYVASFANWQSKEDKGVFEKFSKENNLNVTFVALHTGELKDRYAKLDLVETNIHEKSNNKSDFTELEYVGYYDTRGGITESELRENYKLCDRIADDILTHVDKDDKLEILGTEEFMAFPLRIAKNLEDNDLICKYHATTRSPIQASENSIVKDWTKLPSAYDKDRVTYIYNMRERNYDKLIVITDGDKTDDSFKDAIKEFGKSVILVRCHRKG